MSDEDGAQVSEQSLRSTDRNEIIVSSEAIVIVDLVEATATSDRFGWYSVGRGLFRDLRQFIVRIGNKYGLCCMKSTGDGFLLTFENRTAAEIAAVNAVDTVFELLSALSTRNGSMAEEQHINIRAAVHFGEVDVLEDDREGPNISFAFRLESISHSILAEAINPIESAKFPLRNYVLCSEHVKEILAYRSKNTACTLCGLFKLKGFSGYHEVFLVEKP